MADVLVEVANEDLLGKHQILLIPKNENN